MLFSAGCNFSFFLTKTCGHILKVAEFSYCKQNCNHKSSWLQQILIPIRRLMIKWFRFHSFCGFILTAFLWIFLCYQVLSRSGSLDENDAFNLVEEIVIEDIKEVTNLFFFCSRLRQEKLNQRQFAQTWNTVFPRIVSAETILFWI